MKIAILGAGLTGLTAAYRLSKQGHEVTLLEKENRVGGLAGGFKQENWDWYLDYHYHHLFTSDKFAIELLKEIGAEQDLIFKRPKTKIYYSSKLKVKSEKFQLKIKNGDIFKFDSPFDLLSFPHLSMINIIRTGLVLAFLKLNPFWQNLEKVTAYEWLNKYMGKRAYEVLWEPLFVGKFGEEAKKISMAWFWARIYKRSPSLGYVKGGFQNLANKLVEKIKKAGGNVLLNTAVINCHCEESRSVYMNVTTKQSTQKQIASLPTVARNDNIIVIKYLINSEEHQDQFDKVICTLPSSAFLKVTPNLPTDYIDKLKSIKHLDCLNLILVFKEKFFSDETYWLNINDAGVPFLAVVEHTNFMDRKNYGGEHLVYVGNYLPKEHEFFQKSKEELLAVFDPFLTKFNPDYKKYLVNSHLFRGFEAQPIIPVNYSKMKPDFKTPIDNLYLANMDMVYPWDRGTNYAIELGEKIAKYIMNG